MLGGLHIEKDALKVVGKWLTGSGWAEMICNSGAVSQGVADSFLTAKHVTRTRRAHQVTAACLYILMRKSYEVLQSNVTVDEESKTLSVPFWHRKAPCLRLGHHRILVAHYKTAHMLLLYSRGRAPRILLQMVQNLWYLMAQTFLISH